MPTQYKAKIGKDREIVFRELSVSEFEALLRTKPKGGGEGEGWILTQEGLRRSLVQIDGKPVTYTDLEGSKLGDRFNTREMMLARQAWDRVHTPSAEDLELLGEMEAVATA